MVFEHESRTIEVERIENSEIVGRKSTTNHRHPDFVWGSVTILVDFCCAFFPTLQHRITYTNSQSTKKKKNSPQFTRLFKDMEMSLERVRNCEFLVKQVERNVIIKICVFFRLARDRRIKFTCGMKVSRYDRRPNEIRYLFTRCWE